MIYQNKTGSKKRNQLKQEESETQGITEAYSTRTGPREATAGKQQ